MSELIAWKDKDDFSYDGVYNEEKREASVLKFPEMCNIVCNPVPVVIWKDVGREEAVEKILKWMETLK